MNPVLIPLLRNPDGIVIVGPVDTGADASDLDPVIGIAAAIGFSAVLWSLCCTIVLRLMR